MNNKVLGVIFIGLLGLYAISKMNSGKPVRSFDPEIISLDSSVVNEVLIYPKAGTGEIKLLKEGSAWRVSQNGNSYAVMPSAMNGLFTTAQKITAKRIVAKKSDKWEAYEVGDEQKSRYQFKSGGKVLADFILGRFDFDQQARSATSFVRKVGEDAVYAVDGFLSASLGSDINTFRDKTVLKFNKEELKSLELLTESGSFKFQNNNGQWNDGDGNPQDSTKMANWINRLASLNGSLMVGASPADLSNVLSSIQLMTDSGQQEVKCIKMEGEKPYKIYSSQNKDSWFESDEAGIYKTLFLPEL